MGASFHITGRIGSIQHHDTVTNISIASDRRVKVDGQWKTITDWNRISLFRGLAGYAKDHLGTGDLIEGQGRFAQGSYDKDGETVHVTNFVAERVERLSQAETNRSKREDRSTRKDHEAA